MSSGEHVAVLLPLPLGGPLGAGQGAAYDYRVPDGMTLNPGDFVRVPLGRRTSLGVVWGKGDGDVAPEKIKDVFERLDAPSMPDVQRQFIDWVAAYTLSAPGAVLKMAMSVPDALEPPKPVVAYRLASGMPELKKTAARQRVFDVLADGPPLIQADLAREAAVGVSVVSGLIKAGALVPVELMVQDDVSGPDWKSPGPELSGSQSDAAGVLVKAVADDGYDVTLLDGVPGSGKTEVYFQAVAEALKRGKQVLVLLPEIALSAQWLARFEERFGAPPLEWHSDLTPSVRRRNWRAIAEGRAGVVVGARSALFLPFVDLGLIVADEEHESAFKQEEGVIYNARDMAVVRSSLGDFPIVLCSATPSLETVVNVDEGRYRSLHLADRHGGAELPDVSLVDLRTAAPASTHWLSPVLVDEITKTIAAGEQAMLFLNRRGYAPLTLCRTCGHRFQCPNCTAWLVEHRRDNKRGRLVCHHCGFNTSTPTVCPSCENEGNFAACGPGVERLAEEVAELFPNIRADIATSDSISGPKAAADLVRRIEEHEVDLIIGTQIVAKGYHFPMLTLVGVVDGDLGLSGGDLRAAERTFQLLYQVAGRAGRAERPGRVLIQTHMPEHPVMQALVSGGREGFVETETKARREAKMPPFARLAAVVVSGKNAAQVDRVAMDLGRDAPRQEGLLVLGPAPA
ncbi:MAG: primosomal protein N', partial [Rhodospirillaceae bacterium]|nr:primosomal protein N' [Rhodospirillaceae bacterium]